MARKLAHNSNKAAERENGDKHLLNRRNCLKLGAVAASGALVSGAGAPATSVGSAETGELYTTDFSEYAL